MLWQTRLEVAANRRKEMLKVLDLACKLGPVTVLVENVSSTQLFNCQTLPPIFWGYPRTWMMNG